MSDFKSIKTQLQSLIDRANAKTKRTDKDLTTVIDALIAGYGQSGSVDVYEPYHVLFTDYPLTKTESGNDDGTGKVSTAASGYTMSVKKNPDAVGYGYVEASVSLPTKGCKKVKISYTCTGAADNYINGVSVINSGNTYTLDCAGDTFVLTFKIFEASGNNTATLQITDIYFYRE